MKKTVMFVIMLSAVVCVEAARIDRAALAAASQRPLAEGINTITKGK